MIGVPIEVRDMKFRLLAISILISLAVSSCTMTPAQLKGDFTRLDTAEASTGRFADSSVRWGGIVTGQRNTGLGSCLEVAYFPIDTFSAEPYVGTPNPRGLQDVFWQSHRMLALGVTQKASASAASSYEFVAYGQVLKTPRFLACGAKAFAPDAAIFGAVVTVAGSLKAPQVYEIGIVPAMQVNGIVAWKDPPSYVYHSASPNS